MPSLVIGSGITGMAAAILLAKQGHEVVLIEKKSNIAPLLSGFWRQGLHLDTGFHYAGGLQAEGILTTWLKVLEVDELCQFYSLDTQATETFRFANGQEYILPTGHTAILKQVQQDFPEHTSKVETFLQDIQEAVLHSPYTNPKSTKNEPTLLFSNGLDVSSYLQAMNLPPALETILVARCLLYGVMPKQAHWNEFAMVAGSYFEACHGIVGGGWALVKAFKQILAKYKVKIYCEQAVTHIELNANKQVQAVHLESGQIISGDLCIFTGHPGQLEKLLPPHSLRPVFYKRLQEIKETFPVLILFAKTTSNFLNNKVLYLIKEPGHDKLINKLDQPTPTIYLTGSKHDPNSSDSTVLAIAILPDTQQNHWQTIPRPNDYNEWKQAKAQQLEAQIHLRCPEIQENWQVLDVATNYTLQNWIHGSTGSVYGIAHDKDHIPLLPLTKIKNLLLAGQNILLPGILGGIVSAALSVGFATNHLTVLEDFRKCANNE